VYTEKRMLSRRGLLSPHLSIMACREMSGCYEEEGKRDTLMLINAEIKLASLT